MGARPPGGQRGCRFAAYRDVGSGRGDADQVHRRAADPADLQPASRISSAAILLLLESFPQYTTLGLVALRRASNTPNSTSLGTVLNAETTRAFGTLFASSSAPEEVWAITRSVLSSFIGREQVTI